MVEAKLLRKKLKNGLIVDKWDLVTIIEKQQAEIEALRKAELTDEEILEVITMSHSWIDGYPKKYALDFARAILRKVSEK